MADLWDDSALIKAFNTAMSKYQDMHGFLDRTKSCGHEASKGEIENGNFMSRLLESKADGVEMEKSELLKEAEATEEGNVHCHTETSVEGHDASLQQLPEDPSYDVNGHEVHTSFTQGNVEYQSSEQEQKHQQLLHQLQQLEEQKWQLHQQLSYLGNSYYEQATTSAAWSGSANSYDFHPPYPPMGPYCFPYPPYQGSAYCPIPVMPWSSWPQCSHCALCPSCASLGANHPAKNSNKSEDCRISTAPPVPAESSNLMDKLSSTAAEAIKAAGIGGRYSAFVSTCENEPGKVLQDTGLSDVLLAWFHAGFHTARYFTSNNLG